MFNAIIIISVAVQTLVALFVFQKDKKSATNTFFASLSLALIIWATINYAITRDTFSPTELTLYRLLMASVVIQNTLFFLFSHSYPGIKLNVDRKQLKLYLFLSFIAFGVALSPVLFTKVEIGLSGARPVGGPGMLVFILHAGISVFSGLRSVYRHYSKARGPARQQARLIFIDSIILWGIVPVTNFVVSLATQTLFFAKISPLYTLAFSSIIAYAIVAQKLFDIRAAVARSVGYVLSLGFIGLVYGVLAYGVLANVKPDTLTADAERGIYIGLALVTAFAYPYAKAFFERLTTRLFYKDAYDTQEFLNELNDVLVEKVELGPLLESCAQILTANLKADHATFIIRETAYFPVRVIGSDMSISAEDHQFLKEQTIHVSGKIIVVDNLGDEHGKLRDFLQSKDIAILARLVPNIEYPIEGVGFLALGFKRNGEPYNAKDEDILEIIANELVIAIENGQRFEEIDKFNVTLQDKIDVATKQLKRTNEKLKTLDETKDEFISMASHQLRTPLTSVKGYVSMVLEGDAGEINPTQKKLLEQSFASSQRMVFLIADLLNLSRLRTGKFVIEAKPTNLADVIESEVDQLRASAKSRNLELSYDKPKKFPTLMIDETKIRQVIMNFSDNAIYYTPSGGKIDLKLEETAKEVKFTVNDNGIGIPPEEQHHLFGKFYRAKNAQKARPDGTGLGLFMAKKVIVAQGGVIIFKSKLGKGSTFGFSFSKEKLKVSDTTPLEQKP